MLVKHMRASRAENPDAFRPHPHLPASPPAVEARKGTTQVSREWTGGTRLRAHCTDQYSLTSSLARRVALALSTSGTAPCCVSAAKSQAPRRLTLRLSGPSALHCPRRPH